MHKVFNITGKCYPEKHYMVNIDGRLAQIQTMVDQGDYFCINRARQYGKTTTLSLLKTKLEDRYAVFSLSFEGIGEECFESSSKFAYSFLKLLRNKLIFGHTKHISNELLQFIKKCIDESHGQIELVDFSFILSRICQISEYPIVLMIDEVDQAGNYESFVNFLGVLREKYLIRMEEPTFYSVILAGVYDIKNLKLKVRSEKEHQYNSPWNIAATFDIDMNFSTDEIARMLSEYESEHHTGMNIREIAELIYDYTSGYPFLVSRICKLIDEQVKNSSKTFQCNDIWTKEGVLEAIKILLTEANTLFDDMRKKLTDFPEIRSMFYEILYNGKKFAYNIDDKATDIAVMFGYIRNNHGTVQIANRIFETRLYNLFIFEASRKDALYHAGSIDKNQFIKDGHLDMKHILERFVVHYTDVYGDKDERFHEKEGRKFFMFYLKPIINGTGNYYVEPETRDETKSDLVVDYLGEQYIIELKIWHGNAYHQRGEQQLFDYLNYFHVDKGYMLSFNFNKNKTPGVHEILLKDKILIEAVV